MSPDNWIAFIQDHLIMGIVMLTALGISAYLKPKPVFKLLAVVLLIGTTAYVVSFLVELTSTGIDQTTSFKSRPGKLEK